jgi:uncharacterized protein
MGLFIILFILALCLLLYMLKEAFSNRVIENELVFNDFPSSFGKISIFFISDIHRRVVSDTILSMVKGKADIVIIGGDLAEKGVPMERIKDNVRKLKTIAPVYFVWGNNDYEVDYHELDATLLDFGVKILDNTAVSFESEIGEKLTLLGIDDLNVGRARLDLAISDAGEAGFTILVSHNPRIIESILPGQDIRLVLSGHTHGGQIHIFGYSPYERGKITKKGTTTILVSNGYGTTALPLRLGAPSETHLITLKNGDTL